MITSGTSALPPTGQFTASEESAITDAFHSFSTAQAEVLGPITRAGAVAGMVPVIGPPTANLLSELLVFTDVSRHSVSGRARGNVGLQYRAQNAAGRLIDMIGDDGAESVVADMGMLSQAFEAALGAFS